MYVDERLSRTRALSGDDDAVPLAQDARHPTADTDEDDEEAAAPASLPIRA